MEGAYLSHSRRSRDRRCSRNRWSLVRRRRRCHPRDMRKCSGRFRAESVVRTAEMGTAVARAVTAAGEAAR
eukprot:496926-Prymnesium_polylepis.5